MPQSVIHAAEDDVSVRKQHVVVQGIAAGAAADRAGQPLRCADVRQVSRAGHHSGSLDAPADDRRDFPGQRAHGHELAVGNAAADDVRQYLQIRVAHFDLGISLRVGEVNDETAEGNGLDSRHVRLVHPDGGGEGRDLVAAFMGMEQHFRAVGIQPGLRHAGEVEGGVRRNFPEHFPKGREGHLPGSAPVPIGGQQLVLGAESAADTAPDVGGDVDRPHGGPSL